MGYLANDWPDARHDRKLRNSLDHPLSPRGQDGVLRLGRLAYEARVSRGRDFDDTRNA